MTPGDPSDSTRDADESLRRLEAERPDRVGPFRVTGVLGRGGMGVVYRAHDEGLRREVAVKVLPDAGNEERRQRFLREARSAAALTHPNIVVVYQVGEEQGRVYIAMELVPGESLRQRLARGPLDVPTALDFATQMARGLAAAHDKGLVHRDLKPDNVMITPDGIVKLLDFGLAKHAGNTDARPALKAAFAKTETVVTSDDGRVMGTPEYMSPEQATGQTLDARSDVFSFGVVLYEMLAGVRPFGGTTTGAVLMAVVGSPAPPLRARVPAASEATAAVIEKCLTKEAAGRFAHAGEIVAALTVKPMSAADIGSLPTQTASATEIEALARRTTGSRIRSSKTRMAAWSLAALGVVGLAVGGAWTARRSSAPAAASGSTTAPAPPKVLRIIDLPTPKTDKPEALAVYKQWVRDFYDGRDATDGLRKAAALDPDFAAAKLRLLFYQRGYQTPSKYADALRLRDRLDERERSLLAAFEPCATGEVFASAECNRSLESLLQQRPGDAELALVAAWRGSDNAPEAWLDRIRRAERIDPDMALLHRLASVALGYLGKPDEAMEELRRCERRSPMASLCIATEGELSAEEGRCDEFAETLRRASAISPEQSSVQQSRLNALLASGAPRDVVDAQIEHMNRALRVLTTEHVEAEKEAERAGLAAFWFGDFTAAYDDLARLAGLETQEDIAIPRYEQLVAAEEMADEGRVRDVLKRYVAARGLDAKGGPWDAFALQALRTHHVLGAREASQQWLEWNPAGRKSGYSDWDIWEEVTLMVATTAPEARAAFALPLGSAPLPRKLNATDGYQLGQGLLLAGRPADAAEKLSIASGACMITIPRLSILPFIPRANLLLGKAREQLGDQDGACAAYQKVLDRWGDAKPRSVSADDARAHMKKLACTAR